MLSGPECGCWGGVGYVITGLGHTQKKTYTCVVLNHHGTLKIIQNYAHIRSNTCKRYNYACAESSSSHLRLCAAASITMITRRCVQACGCVRVCVLTHHRPNLCCVRLTALHTNTHARAREQRFALTFRFGIDYNKHRLSTPPLTSLAVAATAPNQIY